MNILAFDTSGDYCLVALQYNDKLYCEPMELVHGHATYLVPLILQTMGKVQFADLDLLGVVNGPGSFTGIRVGLATAHGLAMAARLPLVAVSAFDLYACPDATVLIDSRRGDLFVQKYDAHLNPIGEPQIQKPQDIEATAQINGNGVKLIHPEHIVAPSPQALIDLTKRNYGRSSGLRQDCQPLYLREPDAVIKHSTL